MSHHSHPAAAPMWGFAHNKNKFRYKVFAATITSQPDGTWLEQAPNLQKSAQLAIALQDLLKSKGMDELARVSASDHERPLVPMKQALSDTFDAAVDNWWNSIASSDIVRRTHNKKPAKTSKLPEHLFKRDITPHAANGGASTGGKSHNRPSFSVEVHGMQEHVYELRVPLFTWVQADRYVRIGTNQSLLSPTGGSQTSFKRFEVADCADFSGKGALLSRALTGIIRQTVSGSSTTTPLYGALPKATVELLAMKVIEIHMDKEHDESVDKDPKSSAYLYKAQMIYFDQINGPGRSLYTQLSFRPGERPSPPMVHMAAPCQWEGSGSEWRLTLRACLRPMSGGDLHTSAILVPTQATLAIAGMSAVKEINEHFERASSGPSNAWMSACEPGPIREAFISGLTTYLYNQTTAEGVLEVDTDCPAITVNTSCLRPINVVGQPVVEINWIHTTTENSSSRPETQRSAAAAFLLPFLSRPRTG